MTEADFIRKLMRLGTYDREASLRLNAAENPWREYRICRVDMSPERQQRGPTNTFPDMTRRVFQSDEVVDYEAEWRKAIGE